MSSLSRAFTTRKVKMSLDMSDIHKSPQRSSSTREFRGPILRHKISAPIQLVHTTNMLSYNAPDLPHPSIGGSVSSAKSDAGSESNSLAESTPPTSPDVSLPASACPSPEPNHLSSYFMAPVQEKPQAPAPMMVEPPAIPQRSPSHTKKNSYDAIARQRSISRMSKDSEHTLTSKASFSFSRSSSSSTTASSISNLSAAQSQKPAPTMPLPAPPMAFQQRMYAKEPHPFGHELAQVTELAEEYGVKSTTLMGDAEADFLKENGLFRFTAQDYLSEIQGIASVFFEEAATHARTAAPLWI